MSCAADAVICGALIAEGAVAESAARVCFAKSGGWRNVCPEQTIRKPEAFVRKRIWARSPGARVVLGNGGLRVEKIGLAGWASIEGERQLNMGDACAWARIFDRQIAGSVAAFFAEHVMEHMTPATTLTAAAAAFAALTPGGRLRIAVPDGYDPLNDNRLGTNMITGSAPHRTVWSHATLGEILHRVGFAVEAQAYHDVDGRWHERAWWIREREFGRVRRSSRYDARLRNATGSLIVDGIKPLNATC